MCNSPKVVLEKDCTYQFIAGPNVEFDQVKIKILGKQDLSSSKRRVILEPRSNDSLAVISKSPKSRQQANELSPTKTPVSSGKNGDNFQCTFCKKPRHIKEKYQKLHENPNASSRY